MEQRSTFPKLSRLALTLLAVLAQLSEAERVFSTINQLVTSNRASLSQQSCEMEVLSFRWRELLPQALDVSGIKYGEADGNDDGDVTMVK
jgi:hAT family C-terminal dimerisation region